MLLVIITRLIGSELFVPFLVSKVALPKGLAIALILIALGFLLTFSITVANKKKEYINNAHDEKSALPPHQVNRPAHYGTVAATPRVKEQKGITYCMIDGRLIE